MRFILAAVIVLVYQTASTLAGCPPGYMEYNMACLMVGTNTVNDVTEALRMCYNAGGYLANVKAALKYDFVVDVIKDQLYVYDGYWIGAYRAAGGWVWRSFTSTGEITTTPVGYANWAQDQPDDWSSFPSPEDNVAIMVHGVSSPYAWYSENSYKQTVRGMGYVCEAHWKENV